MTELEYLEKIVTLLNVIAFWLVIITMNTCSS